MLGFGLGNCEHLNTLELNEFDGDGTIVTQKIVCQKCGKTSAKVYEVINSQSIWNDRSECPHNMFTILAYKKLPDDQITCEVMCMKCNLFGDNLYTYTNLSVCGWEKKD
jgi:hypothetical protein